MVTNKDIRAALNTLQSLQDLNNAQASQLKFWQGMSRDQMKKNKVLKERIAQLEDKLTK